MTRTRRTAMNAAASLLNRIDGWPVSPLYRGCGVILMFHRVLPEADAPRIWANSYLEVTPDYLENTFRYFRGRGYAFLPVGGIPDYLAQEKISRPFVAYTFDDGFKDNAIHALPLFRRHNVPFAINVTTGFPDHTAVLWWSELERLLLARDRAEITILGETRSFDTATPERKHEAFRAISRWLKAGREGTEGGRVRDMLTRAGIDPHEEVRRAALNWDELRVLARDPLVTIGAHSLTHTVLSGLSDGEAEAEISGGRRQLESELGIAIDTMAYPFGGPGEIGEREIALARKAGFRLATTTFSSMVHPAHRHALHSLPRMAVGMSMNEATFDLVHHGVIPFVRNRGRRVVTHYA